MMSSLPLYIKGPVVKGYGRGSSQLGFPTGTTINLLYHISKYANIF